MALRHAVCIVTGSGALEFHLDHRVDRRHGQHRILSEAGFAAWMADAGELHPSFQVAAACPCQRGAVAGEPAAAPR